MKLIPASSARGIMRMQSSWSVLPQAPNIIVPRHSGLTFTPVRPRVRTSIGMNRKGSASALARPRARLAGAAAAAGVAYAFAVIMLGTTLPTPLYPIYVGRFGFSGLTVTVIFAIYALG